MKFSKKLIISSENKLDNIAKITIKEYKFNHPYDIYNAQLPINEFDIDVNIDFYKETKTIGSLNYINIPFDITTSTNVIAFCLFKKDNNKIMINNESDVTLYNLLYNDMFVMIREVKLNYYYYEIDINNKLKCLPFVKQYCSEIKYKLNNIKRIYNKIGNQLDQLLTIKSPLFNNLNYDTSINGFIDGLYKYNNPYHFFNPVNPTSPYYTKQLEFDKLNNFLYTIHPLLAMIIHKVGYSHVKYKTTIYPNLYYGYNKAGTSNIIDTLDLENLTPFYAYIKNITELLKQLKQYTITGVFNNSNNIDDEIKLFEEYIDDKNIISSITQIIINGIDNPSSYNFKYDKYGPVKFKIDLDMKYPPDLDKKILTLEKLYKYINDFKKNTSIVLTTIDESIFLLNNLFRFQDNIIDHINPRNEIHKLYDGYITKDDDNILFIINKPRGGISNNLLYYGLCNFYFRNISKYPTLSFKKLKEDQLLKKLKPDNLKRLLSKLILVIEGLIALNKENKITLNNGTNVIDENILYRDNIELIFIDQINKNEILHLLEKKAYHNNIIGSHVIYNPDLNGHKLHHHLVHLNTTPLFTEYFKQNLINIQGTFNLKDLFDDTSILPEKISNIYDLHDNLDINIVIKIIKYLMEYLKNVQLSDTTINKLKVFNSNSNINNLYILLKTV